MRAGLGALATMGATGGVSAVTNRESISSGVKFGVHTIKSALGSGFTAGNNASNQYSPSNNAPNSNKADERIKKEGE